MTEGNLKTLWVSVGDLQRESADIKGRLTEVWNDCRARDAVIHEGVTKIIGMLKKRDDHIGAAWRRAEEANAGVAYLRRRRRADRRKSRAVWGRVKESGGWIKAGIVFIGSCLGFLTLLAIAIANPGSLGTILEFWTGKGGGK